MLDVGVIIIVKLLVDTPVSFEIFSITSSGGKESTSRTMHVLSYLSEYLISLNNGSFNANALPGPEPRALNLFSLFWEERLHPAY